MTHSRVILFVTAFLFVTALAWQASAKTVTTVTTQEPSKLVVEAHDLGNGTVSGHIKNLTNDTVQQVTLLIQHTWNWKNEYRPGPASDNPGRSEFRTISKPIAPGGSVDFQFAPTKPLPHRNDGYFTTSVSVEEYTAVSESPSRTVF
jgi:hypothetical protein